jgi:hypothetical protein
MTRETLFKMRGRGAAGSPRAWTHDETERLRGHLKAGVPLVDIGRALGRTPEDVAAKLIDFQPVQIRFLETKAAGRGPHD